MRRYEAVVILDPDLSDEDIGQLTERYSGLIKKTSGEVIKIEDWGTRRLAYQVKRKDKGRYILLDFVGRPELLAELERQFKIAEEVMKFLSVKLDDNVDLGAFQAQAEKKEQPAEPAVAAAPAETAEAATPPQVDQAAAEAVPESAAPSEGDDAPTGEAPDQSADNAAITEVNPEQATVKAENEGGN